MKIKRTTKINNGRMKILFLANWFPSRANPVSGIFIEKHAKAAQIYFDVAVLHISADKNLKDIYEPNVVIDEGLLKILIYYKDPQHGIIPQIKRVYRYLKSSYIGLRLVIKKWGLPDLVHLNVALPIGILALFLKLFKNIPYVVTEHETRYLRADGRFQKSSVFNKLFTKWIICQAECVTTVSSALKESMLKLGLKNEYSIIPNVVETPDDQDFLKFRMKKEKKIILNVSLLDDFQKNISGLIKVVKEVSKIRNDFELHIIGSGKDEDRLKKLAQELEIIDKVVYFHGLKPHSEVVTFMKSADFLVVNSNFETFSVVAAEALANGLPVIATKCGGPEDFINSKNGILIEPGNLEELKEAIIWMLDNSHLFDRSQLRQFAIKKFGIQTIAQKLRYVYYYAYNKFHSRTSFFLIGQKKLQHYKNILIKSDTKLHEQVTFELMRLVKPPAKILDFGCGEGALSQRLKDIGYDVYSADINSEGFKAESKFIKLDFEDWKQMDNFSKEYRLFFDAIVSVEVIEHIENLELYIRTARKVLVPGGYFIITTPNVASRLSRLFFLIKGFPFSFSKEDLESYGHINPIFYQELIALLERNRFKVYKLKAAGFLPLIWLTKDWKMAILNGLSVALSPLMQGIKEGWCILAITKKE